MAQNSTRKIIIPVAIVAVAILAVALALRHGQHPTVQVATITKEDLSSTVSSNGVVEPISPATARAEFPTFVDKIFASEGQEVHRGQVILTLDAADIRSQLAQAQADLVAAQITLKNARAGGPPDEVAQLNGDLRQAQVESANLERTHQSLQQLVAKQAATKDELAQNEAALAKSESSVQVLEQRKKDLTERAGADAESAALRVAEAQSQVQSFAEKVRSATITAVDDGTLYSLPVHTGDYVKVGDVLAVMADLKHVRVRAFVDEPDLGGLEPNQEVDVTWDAKPDMTWTGRTEQIPKQVVARGERSVGEVLCTVDNAKLDLLPNVNVDVRIIVRKRDAVVAIPRGAVLEDNGQYYVYLVDGDETLHRQQITLGIASASKYEVTSGLSTGQKVAIPGDQSLRDGMEVRIAEAL
jgi:HlyD family secretion protein